VVRFRMREGVSPPMLASSNVASRARKNTDLSDKVPCPYGIFAARHLQERKGEYRPLAQERASARQKCRAAFAGRKTEYRPLAQGIPTSRARDCAFGGLRKSRWTRGRGDRRSQKIPQNGDFFGPAARGEIHGGGGPREYRPLAQGNTDPSPKEYRPRAQEYRPLAQGMPTFRAREYRPLAQGIPTSGARDYRPLAHEYRPLAQGIPTSEARDAEELPANDRISDRRLGFLVVSVCV